MKVTRCKCGCGRKMPDYKLRIGIEFYSPSCAEWWEAIGQFVERRKKTPKEKTEVNKPKTPPKTKKPVYISQIISKPRADINDRYSYNGIKKCLRYDDMNIQCVMCFENKCQETKYCFKNPKKKI